MLFPRPVQQVATLPFVPIANGFEVLLITSRGGGRWLLPKGWPPGGRDLAQTARREAEEEAGVVGRLHETPIGSYSYDKEARQGYRVHCLVFVFPLLVELHLLSWLEQHERQRRWSRLADVAAMVAHRDLARLLSELAADDGERLRAAVAAIDGATVTQPPSPAH